MRATRRAAATVLALTAVLAAACSASTTSTTADGAGMATTAAGSGVTGSSAAKGGSGAPAAGTATGGPTQAGAKRTPGPVPARYQGATSDLYGHDENWLCKPGIAQNYCETENIDSTVIDAQGTAKVVPRSIVKDAPVDCFYVYPTVNLQPGGGNDMGMSDDVGIEVTVLKIQGERFTELCNMYAPLYRQMYLSAYTAPPEQKDKSEAIAYADVVDAFHYYMAHENKGRPVVLIGHSQGSGHLAHLLRDEFDDDPDMRGRLVSALLIGGDALVPPGRDVGGSFQNIPLCRSTTQTACVVGYNSYGDDVSEATAGFFGANDKGLTNACVNPAAPGGGSGPLDPYVPGSTTAAGIPSVGTAFIQLPKTMKAECRTVGTNTLLVISADQAPGDPRDVSALVKNQPGWGLHLTEFNLTLGNLMTLVRTQIGALG